MTGLEEKFSKILVAIDGSRPSMDAVDYAITIAQTPTTFDYTSDTLEDQIPEIVKDIVHYAKKNLNRGLMKYRESESKSGGCDVTEGLLEPLQ